MHIIKCSLQHRELILGLLGLVMLAMFVGLVGPVGLVGSLWLQELLSL